MKKIDERKSFNKININGYEYEIISRETDSVLGGEETYEYLTTNITRERKIIAFCEVINGKFYFLKRVLVKERLIFERFKEYNDVNYLNWREWTEYWEKEEVI